MELKVALITKAEKRGHSNVIMWKALFPQNAEERGNDGEADKRDNVTCEVKVKDM